MKKVFIGVVGRAGIIDNRPNIYIDENFRKLIYNNGCIPVLILPNQNIEYKITPSKDIHPLDIKQKQQLIEIIDMCDAIIIPGGNRQFEYDKFIYKYSLAKNIPVLGICLGMQLMCNVDNEQIQKTDVPIKNESNINHNQPEKLYTHKVKINKDSKLYEIIKEDDIYVNSLHGYHIEKVNKLKAVARSEDGYIEAVEMPGKKFVMGLQWHPEKSIEENKINTKIIKQFIKVAKEVSNARSIKENI